jgi:DNA-binding MarR family transcriptional regulator
MPPRRKPLPTVPHPDVPPLPKAVTSAVGFLVNEVAALFRGGFERALAEQKLRPRGYLLLLVLRDEGTMAQHALGARIGMDRTTTMQVMQALEEQGLVQRRDDPEDRRVYRVSLTAAGRRLVASLEGRIRRVETELLAPIPAAERPAFVAQLRAILGDVPGSNCGTGESAE